MGREKVTYAYCSAEKSMMPSELSALSFFIILSLSCAGSAVGCLANVVTASRPVRRRVTLLFN